MTMRYTRLPTVARYDSIVSFRVKRGIWKDKPTSFYRAMRGNKPDSSSLSLVRMTERGVQNDEEKLYGSRKGKRPNYRAVRINRRVA